MMDRVKGSWWVVVGVVALAAIVMATGAAWGAAHGEDVEYADGATVLWGYLAYDDSFEGTRPGVVIVHDWRGLTAYEEARARKLAEAGYVVFAVDMFGRHTLKGNPREAGRWTDWFERHPADARRRFEAGLKVLAEHELVDAERLAAAGYGFGGGICLDMARLGVELDAVVSFYGRLRGAVSDEDTGLADASGDGHLADGASEDGARVTAKILVCRGADDERVTGDEVAAFENEMRAAGADWQLITYGGAKHGFADPDAKGPGTEYDERADARSWEALKGFLGEVFLTSGEDVDG